MPNLLYIFPDQFRQQALGFLMLILRQGLAGMVLTSGIPMDAVTDI